MTLGVVTRERWRVLEPLLDAALELAPARREAFVIDACGHDDRQRAELEALLEACDHADSILSEPASIAYQPLLIDDKPSLPRELGGRYHIVREIGRGGMATVYLANDPKHGRQVAVKVLHGEVARLIGRDRFLREIEIAARLSHPHILPLHDSGDVPSDDSEGSDILYFVSPFVTGESLRDRMQHEPRMAIDEVLRLGREIAQALDYAHRQGVVHLDVKPENILLQDGHAIIADFGIARAMRSANEQSFREPTREPTPLLGTPSYMSPEQALGAPDVDGRSDIYSLGCVLYEMITGARPFGRLSVSEAVDRAREPITPDRSSLAERSSREVASVIMRALDPSRQKRFQTAGDLAVALGGTARERKMQGWRRRAVVTACIAAASIPFVVHWINSDPPLDSDLIAIAPFDAEAQSLSLWREGLVDVMSRNLDGAGPLRAVPASMAVRRWQGRADAQSARAFGKRTGARLVLFGLLLEAGDSVRVAAVLLDASTGQPLAEIERRDIPARVDRLTDSLTVGVLRELGRSRRIDMARATSAPTNSIAALKAYLQGEQFYRAAELDSAQTWFERALTLDSAFALAYHRLASVRIWRDPKDIPDSATFELMRRASWFPRGLGPRERLLATVDSLSAEAEFAWRHALNDGKRYVDENKLVARLHETLNEGLRQYPNDSEFWFLLAEARWRYDRDVVPGERDDRALLSLYDRTIALDSAFAPAYLTPISLAAYLDGPSSARRYIRSYLALAPSGIRSQILRFDDALLDPARIWTIDPARLVDTLADEELCGTANMLRHVTDSAEVVVRFARAFANRHPQSAAAPPPNVLMCAVPPLVRGLQFRGHLRDAYRLASLTSHGYLPMAMVDLARFGMVPKDSSREMFDRILGLAPKTMLIRLYPWWIDQGDTAAIQTYMDVFANRIATRHFDGVSLATNRAALATGRASLALARRDTALALELLLTSADTLHPCQYQTRETLVDLLIATGHVRGAAQRLQRRWPGTSECSDGVDDVLWTLKRARVSERLGKRESAAADYDLVATAWRTADPELQPYVREARAGLARLRAKMSPSSANAASTDR
jgi:serine/threonine-protein kinase